ncbi:MAG: hypothetical protein JWM99_1097 [Verrucomicrobiales bacterium]|nr:hypothetical protein [Verrucomicrobiales bacterium]
MHSVIGAGIGSLPPRQSAVNVAKSNSIVSKVRTDTGTDSFGLETVDLRDYSHPSSFANSLPWISFDRVVGYGEWGFSSTSSGFATLDLRNPNNVPIVQTIPESAYSVNLGDNKAFLGRGARGVAVYHLPDVLPKIIAQPTGGIVESGQAFRLETSVSGSVPLTFQWSKDGVDIPGATNLHLTIESFAPRDAGDYVVAISNSSGIVRSKPASVNELTPMAFDKIGSIPQGGLQFHLADGTLFVANGRGIDRWDVTDPSSPRNAGRIEISGVPQMQVFAVRVTNKVAYVAAGYGGLLIYNLNPLKYLGGILGDVVQDVEVFGTRVFITLSQGSLLSVDVSNPIQPKVVGSWQRSYLPYSPLRLDPGGSYLLASVLSEGLILFDPAVGGNPAPIGTSIADGYISGASVYKDWAVTMVSDGARVIDLSDPSRPTTMARYPISKTPKAFAMSGALAYFATENDGLEVLNVSEPTQPILIGHYASSWSPSDMCVDGPYVYIADLVNGITILKSRPENGLYLHSQKTSNGVQFRWASGFGAVLQSASPVDSPTWIDLRDSKFQSEMDISPTNEVRFFKLKVP